MLIREIREPFLTTRTWTSVYSSSRMFASTVHLILLAVVGLSHGYTFSSLPYHDHGYAESQAHPSYYQTRSLQHYPRNDINRPIIYPQLGMSPEYHNLVYKYITGFAGTEDPPHAKVEEFGHHNAPENVEESHLSNKDKEEGEETGTETEKPGLNDYLLPSDFILLSKRPHGQFYFDTIKIKKKNSRENPMTNPPLGGVVSNYLLLRNRPDYQNFIPFTASSDTQVSKRQIPDSSDVDDTVTINAENPHNVKINEDDENTRDQNEMNENEEGEEDQPAIAQSKPAAIALAGPGGVAQASPVGTALVGPGGLAVAAPSGTAVAGPAGQGAISPSSDDKTKIVQKKIKEVWN